MVIKFTGECNLLSISAFMMIVPCKLALRQHVHVDRRHVHHDAQAATGQPI